VPLCTPFRIADIEPFGIGGDNPGCSLNVNTQFGSLKGVFPLQIPTKCSVVDEDIDLSNLLDDFTHQDRQSPSLFGG
jgi:hypothetical protein